MLLIIAHPETHNFLDMIIKLWLFIIGHRTDCNIIFLFIEREGGGNDIYSLVFILSFL